MAILGINLVKRRIKKKINVMKPKKDKK
jgi:hypothetical protein